MAARPAGASLPPASSTQQPRVAAGRYEGLGTPGANGNGNANANAGAAPVGRVAGRYDGFDAIVATANGIPITLNRDRDPTPIPRDPTPRIPAPALAMSEPVMSHVSGARARSASPRGKDARSSEARAAEVRAADARAAEARATEARAAESRAAEARAMESRATESRAAESRAVAVPAEKRANTKNDRVPNTPARPTGADTPSPSGQGQFLGVMGLLRNPRNRLHLATLVAMAPFLVTFSFYVNQFSFWGQLGIGVLCGLCIQGVYKLYTLHRSHHRKYKAVQIAQMATLDENQLKTLLPNWESFPRWISFSDFETMEWLNKTMTKLWPYIDQAAGDLIKQKVQPILDQYAMGIIQKLLLKEVAFGNKAPQVTGVRLSPGLEDETVLEIKILWQTSKEGVVLSVDFPGPNYKVKLKNWHLKGTAKLIFKPLTGTMPGFGAVLVSLTEPPDFDFDLSFLGGDVGALPGVEKMIDSSIRTALVDSLVWPSRIVVPMIPGHDFSFLELHPVGELEVTLIEGKNIKNTDLIGKTDPFVVLYVRQTKDKVKRSKSKKNTLKPHWNETFKIEVEDPESQKLTLRLMDDESIEKSEYIGTVSLAIKEFTPRVRMERWCDVLKDPESHNPKQIRGSLHIIVTYIPYTRAQVSAKRGGSNETEKKIYKEQQIRGAHEKMSHDNTTADAPKQQGNITQHPDERPRAPGPAADLS